MACIQKEKNKKDNFAILWVPDELWDEILVFFYKTLKNFQVVTPLYQLTLASDDGDSCPQIMYFGY
jgi:hypothetical protein